MDNITAHGMTMPKLGLGTWRMKGDECRDAVEMALSLGYRHIDTAEMYGNEDGVGAALARTAVPRADIHLTSKVWWDHLAPDAMQAAIDGSLARLGTDYLDLYLVHWPAPDMDLPQVMDGLMKLQQSGKTRAIGVANFPSALLDQAAGLAPIACNQVEYHVLLNQDKLLAAQKLAGVPLVAYAPLAQGRLAEHEAFTKPYLATLASLHERGSRATLEDLVTESS